VPHPNVVRFDVRVGFDSTVPAGFSSTPVEIQAGVPSFARPMRKSLPCFAEAPSEAEGGTEGVGILTFAALAPLPNLAGTKVVYVS
jgi:hypothetical protein